jgi:hypothetical protein
MVTITAYTTGIICGLYVPALNAGAGKEHKEFFCRANPRLLLISIQKAATLT